MNKIRSKFKIAVSSDLEYEKLVVYLMFDDQIIAILNNDLEFDKPIIKIEDRFEERTVWELPMNEFIGELQRAQQKLLEVNRDDG